MDADPDAVLHPIPPIELSERTTAILRWTYVGVVVAASAWWLWLVGFPGVPHPFVLFPTLLVLVALAAYPVALLGRWFITRFGADRIPLHRTTLAASFVLLALVLATWAGLPVRVKFELHRGEFNEVVELITKAHGVDGSSGESISIEVDGYGSVDVSSIDGGLWFELPVADSDRASGFAYLPADSAGPEVPPEMALVRSLGGGWYEAERSSP